MQRYDLAVMPGWQAGWSGLALKGYLGPAMETRQVLPLNPEKALSGASWGAKTALESWMALGSSAWLTADASYFTGTEAYTGTLRLGWQALSWLTLGPETAAFGDEEDDSTRAGGFLRIDLGKSEATFSGGWSSVYHGDASLYGQASVYMRF